MGAGRPAAVVVGAGLAGLAAADELDRAGCDVTVLEARDRVGGRVHSRRLENGAVVEMGAEFILPGSTVTEELAERHGLGLWQKGMFYGDREPRDGPGVDPLALAEAVQSAVGALAAEPQAGALPADRFLDELEIGEEERSLMRARLEISCASTASEVPARAIARLGHIGREPAPSIAGGNDGLARAIADRLGDRVELGSPVRRIAWAGGGVTVLAAAGERSADACVIAIPARVVDAIEFEPALPPGVLEALSAIRYGHAAKMFVPLAGTAAPSAVMSVPGRYWTWTSTGDGDDVQPVLSCFAGSSPALEALGVAAGPARWLESARALRPELELEPDGVVLSTWDDDPWVGAAYSAHVPAEAEAVLAEPVGPIAFAGEHLGGEFAALMEGALRSGRRAAGRVAALLA
jgi:monoamine oxidase